MALAAIGAAFFPRLAGVFLFAASVWTMSLLFTGEQGAVEPSESPQERRE
jgi:hypothetical protein